MKTDIVHARVEARHKAKLRELMKSTGLGEGEVVRRLIESAAAMPVPVVSAGNGTSVTSGVGFGVGNN